MSVLEILIAHGDVELSLGLIDSLVNADDAKVRAEIIAEKRAEAPYLAAFMAGIALWYAAAVGVPRKPGASVIGLVVISTTIFPFLITAAGSVPLIISWVRPETKRYFNRRP